MTVVELQLHEENGSSPEEKVFLIDTDLCYDGT